MSEFTSPTEIAREALRRLAVGKRAPTPEHFRELYNDIAGVPPDPAQSAAEGELRRLIAELLSAGPLVQLADRAGIGQEGRQLAGRARSVAPGELEQLGRDTAEYCRRIEKSLASVHEMQDGLLRLLRLLVDNVQSLIVEDTWVLSQLEVVRELVGRPTDMQAVSKAEGYLREVLLKQGAIRNGLAEAKDALRKTVQSFLGHLSEMADDTDEYGKAIESHAAHIGNANDVRALGSVIDGLLRDTRAMQQRTAQRQRAWREDKERAEAAEARILELEQELRSVGDQLRVDHLTGALNRRGFEEAFTRMVATAQRGGGTCCLALLDVDNFKQLNDRYGHSAGDSALVHLARVIREAIRPSDDIARHGGEEFLILLPDTDLPGAEALVVRLQRELTRQYFLQENERVLITFSAGVAQWMPGESMDAALQRADAAQYLAKTSGKNRVMVAPAPAAAGPAPRAAAGK